MFNTKDVVVYIAGAGSGKTTALMQELTKMLKIYRPDEVALSTFTRKGVSAGIERALQTNPLLTLDDLPYFETIHKMCFREAGMKRKNIMEKRDIAKFNYLLGFKLQLSSAFDRQTDDDKLLQRYDALRGGADTGVFIHTLYDEERYHRFVHAYETFKRENNLVDFYDCLIRYVEIGKPLPIAAYLLDEAQDIGPLQWNVVELAAKNAEKVRIGGDPAQSIYTYLGCDPSTLIELAQKNTLVELNSTYRLPKKLCSVADSIIDLMETKLERKHIAVRNVTGHLQEVADKELLARIIKRDLDSVGHKDYRWFCLFRTNCHIMLLSEILERFLVPYHTSKGFVISERELNKIKRFYKYRELGYGSEEAKEAFMKANDISDINACFTESNLIPSDRRWIYKDYVEAYGIDELIYMANKNPVVLLTTIHKVKGGEADNVAVFLDATKQVSESVMIDLDGELRVMYVACTRARDALYVIRGETKHNLHDIWEAISVNMI